MATIDRFPEEYSSMVGTVETKEDSTLCPFKMANPNLYRYAGAWNCEKEMCAWWSKDLNACPLSKIGR